MENKTGNLLEELEFHDPIPKGVYVLMEKMKCKKNKSGESIGKGYEYDLIDLEEI